MKTKRFAWMAMLMLVTFAFCSALIAQEAQPDAGGPPQEHGHRGPGRMDPARQLDMLSKRLDLTGEQKSKVKTILESADAKRRELFERRQQNNGEPSQDDREAMRQKMEQIRTDTDDQIRAVLNADQQAKFDQMKSQQKQRMQRRGGPGGDAPPPDPQQ